MKITIESEPKEIADLIAQLQGQHISKPVFNLSVPNNIDMDKSLAHVTDCCCNYLIKENSL